MIEFELLQDKGVLIVEPKAALTAEDFRALAATLDPYLSENPTLEGLLIRVAAFPGWTSFSAFVAHVRFVRDHQRKISRIAFATDNPFLRIPPTIASFFAHPEFRFFSLAEREQALAWLASGA
jgi:hypothetical protein